MSKRILVVIAVVVLLPSLVLCAMMAFGGLWGSRFGLGLD